MVESSAVVVAVGNLVGLDVDVEVMISMFLSAALGFLALRERRLHDERPKLGPQRVETYVLIVV